MSGLFKAYKTNETAEQNGIPVVFREEANTDGTFATFYVRYSGSKAHSTYRAALEAAYKPFKRRVEAEDQSAKDQWVARTNDLFCDYMVSGWEHIFDAQDEPIVYSKEACRALMRELPIVLGKLVSASVDFERFRDEDIKADAKN